MENFLHGGWEIPEEGEIAAHQLPPKWHIPVILQNGERMYLNVYQSQFWQCCKITAAELGKKD